MLVHHGVTPIIEFADCYDVHLYPWVEIDTCYSASLVSPARVQTQTIESGFENTNREATMP